MATVLESTLGGTIVWIRNTFGNYSGTLTGAFTIGKTVGFIQSNNSSRPCSCNSNVSANTIEISTNGPDDILNNASIEIRVYN